MNYKPFQSKDDGPKTPPTLIDMDHVNERELVEEQEPKTVVDEGGVTHRVMPSSE